MDGIAVAAEGGHSDIAVLELLFPGARLGRVGQQLLHGTMAGAGVAPGADLHRLQPQSSDLLQHLLESEMVINRVENANQQLAPRVRRRTLSRTGLGRGSSPRPW